MKSFEFSIKSFVTILDFFIEIFIFFTINQNIKNIKSTLIITIGEIFMSYLLFFNNYEIVFVANIILGNIVIYFIIKQDIRKIKYNNFINAYWGSFIGFKCFMIIPQNCNICYFIFFYILFMVVCKLSINPPTF